MAKNEFDKLFENEEFKPNAAQKILVMIDRGLDALDRWAVDPNPSMLDKLITRLDKMYQRAVRNAKEGGEHGFNPYLDDHDSYDWDAYHSRRKQAMSKQATEESRKFRFDELFDPTGRSQSAADKYLRDKGSNLLSIDTTPSSSIDATHETDDYKQMSNELMKAYKMAWQNNMQLDGHTLENIARVAQQLQNMSSVAESSEIDEIVEKAGIKRDDND